MPQKPLIVHVEERETGATWTYAFDAGPVVVGRGDDVGVLIDRPFVSLHHGTFHFDDGGATYVDLDSRNGTLIDGAPRGSDRPIPLTEATDIRIGRVCLRISRAAPAKAAGAQPKNPFAPAGVSNASKKATDALPREEIDRIRRELAPAKPEAPPPAPAAPILAKTEPMPTLPPRPVVAPPARADPPAPSSQYAAGGTKAVPLLREPPIVRPRQSATRPREVSDAPKVVRRGRPPRERRKGPWLVVALAAVVVAVAVAAIVLLVTGGDHPRRRQPMPGSPPALVDVPRSSVNVPLGSLPELPTPPEPVPTLDPAPPAADDEAARPVRRATAPRRRSQGPRTPATSASTPILP